MPNAVSLLLDFTGCAVLFWGVVFGLGLPLVAGSTLSAPEKTVIGAGAGLIAAYLLGLAAYALPSLPLLRLATPGCVVILVALRWRVCREILRDPSVRDLLASYLLVTGWVLGFLTLVRSYSGASWALDWLGHYERAQVFGGIWPADRALFGNDVVPSRPPLANVVTGSLLTVTGFSFSQFQILTSLASSLAFLPGWLWAVRIGRGSRFAPAAFTVLVMVNPSMMENATFAWTKLPTVFLVLCGLYLFVPLKSEASSPSRLSLAFLLLAGGLLTHYSAAPYILSLVAVYVWQRRREWRSAEAWRQTALVALPAALLLLTWFGWAIARYGVADTFLSNTSVTLSHTRSFTGFFAEKALNLVNTLVPHVLRAPDYAFIEQSSTLGYVRDFAFLLYQVNLPLLFGSSGAVVLMRLLVCTWKHASPAPRGQRGFWAWFVGCTVVLGTAANGGIDVWGIAHLCLLGLLVLGLAFIAGRIDDLSRGWRIALAIGLAGDFVLGVALQFHLQNLIFPPADLAHNAAGVLSAYGPGAWLNLQYKLATGWTFVGDADVPRPLLLAGLTLILGMALGRLRRALTEQSSVRPDSPYRLLPTTTSPSPVPPPPSA